MTNPCITLLEPYAACPATPWIPRCAVGRLLQRRRGGRPVATAPCTSLHRRGRGRPAGSPDCRRCALRRCLQGMAPQVRVPLRHLGMQQQQFARTCECQDPGRRWSRALFDASSTTRARDAHASSSNWMMRARKAIAGTGADAPASRSSRGACVHRPRYSLPPVDEKNLLVLGGQCRTVAARSAA
jgi:hypothetical protein